MNKTSVTRNSKHMLRLPKFNLEYGKSYFMFMGALIYNELPLEILKLDNFKDFSTKLTAYLS